MTSEVIDSKNGACLDELALCLKAGEPGAALKLWDAVRRFVEMKARKRAVAVPRPMTSHKPDFWPCSKRRRSMNQAKGRIFSPPSRFR